MKRTKRTVAFVILGLLTATASHAEIDTFLCATDYAVGFRYDKSTDSWSPTQFKPRKFVFRHYDPARDKKYSSYFTENDQWNKDPATHGLFDVADNSLVTKCKLDTGPYKFAPFVCSAVIGDVRFNDNMSKFVYEYDGSYLSMPAPDEGPGPDTPVLEIGHCTPFYPRPKY